MSDRAGPLLFVFALLAIVFSVELPLSGLGTRYASINSEDLAALLVLGTFVYTRLRRNEWTLRLYRSTTVPLLAAVSGWIVLTVVVAAVRAPAPITGSLLWTLKWFEVVVFYALVQHMIDEFSGYAMLRTLLIAGVVLSGYAVVTSIVGIGSYRTRVFFHNPNSLALFFNLVVLSFASRAVLDDGRYRSLSVLGAILGVLALLSTGSRSGIVGLVAGLTLLAFLLRRRVTPRQYAAAGVSLAASAVAAPTVIAPRLIERLTQWIQFTNGTLGLTDHRSARAIKHRIDLLEKGFELFLQRPVFGHGWYASPGRLPPLDIHYTTLLPEVGLIGFLLFLTLYASIARDWFRVASASGRWFGYAGLAWFCSILAQSIGGNFLRTPQVLFLLFLLLTAGQAATRVDERSSGGTS